VNRATLYGPGGIVGHQDKQIMTRFEREIWFVEPGAGLPVFDTLLGRIGILICYDSEFPLLARRMVEAGAEVLLVPSCTDSLAGFTRVRVGAWVLLFLGLFVLVAWRLNAAYWKEIK
jgi:predicted amidohydrolase